MKPPKLFTATFTPLFLHCYRLSPLFIKSSQLSTRTTRAVNSSCSFTLYIPICPTNRLQKSIMYNGVKIYTNIRLAIKSFPKKTFNLLNKIFCSYFLEIPSFPKLICHNLRRSHQILMKSIKFAPESKLHQTASQKHKSDVKTSKLALLICSFTARKLTKLNENVR